MQHYLNECGKFQVRVLISDFAVFISIVLMSSIDYMVGLKTSKLSVPESLSVSFFAFFCF